MGWQCHPVGRLLADHNVRVIRGLCAPVRQPTPCSKLSEPAPHSQRLPLRGGSRDLRDPKPAPCQAAGQGWRWRSRVVCARHFVTELPPPLANTRVRTRPGRAPSPWKLSTASKSAAGRTPVEACRGVATFSERSPQTGLGLTSKAPRRKVLS